MASIDPHLIVLLARVIDAANSGFARQYVTLQYGADMEYFDGVYDE